jgi:Asp-tRNA(Asn)/Glu-tRNA(Gln) amidotransferase C subunit
MAQGQFTKEEAEQTKKAVEEMFNAIPKSRRMEYVGHLNDIFLFIEAAQKVAPSESEPEPTSG